LGSAPLLRRASRRFVVGIEGPEPTAAERSILSAFPPAGVILFRRNLASARQTRQLNRQLREIVGRPIFLAIDQEGGRVDRLASFQPPRPSAEELASRGERGCERGGRSTACALRGLDFDVDFAPVVDLRPENGEGIGFGGRTFGDDPDSIAPLAGAFLRGLAERGVAGCLKHFPGLGRGRVDSHLELPKVEASRAELLGSDLEPFRRLAAEAPGVMVSHGLYEALDPRFPASLSSRIVRGLLLGRLGFLGGVFSDDLEMGALAAFGDLAERSVRAFAAGNSFLLVCRRLEELPRCAEAVARRSARRGGEEILREAERRDRRFRRGLASSGSAPAPRR
jgi:beta-N-acetylhexosaminidase